MLSASASVDAMYHAACEAMLKRGAADSKPVNPQYVNVSWRSGKVGELRLAVTQFLRVNRFESYGLHQE